MKKDYQVIARRYRPQRFSDVLGQEPIVTTLKNMIRLKRSAHAYLFCGSKGTGKTTLARLFAKALNCLSLTDEGEPCNTCSSCREIVAGNSLEILEIDGASNRGIEDIRQINEAVGYVAGHGRYKIYIIDEVHMLTKEAFNALLKTLEEPPAGVKFFFATTEPHKVPPTILSRCQRFNLRRIHPDIILQKLSRIAADVGVEVDNDALQLISQMAEGGLRDAESLFDQVLAFHQGRLTREAAETILGVMPSSVYFQIDEAGHRGDLKQAFVITEQLFHQGKDPLPFMEGLISHFRQLLMIKLSDSSSSQSAYAASAKLYSRPQLLDLLEYLVTSQNRVRTAPSSRFALEAILLHVMRSHHQIPLDVLVKKLSDLENAVAGQSSPPPVAKVALGRISEDPTPQPSDLNKATPVNENPIDRMERKRKHDTVLQFAAVELQGTLETR